MTPQVVALDENVVVVPQTRALEHAVDRLRHRLKVMSALDLAQKVCSRSEASVVLAL